MVEALVDVLVLVGKALVHGIEALVDGLVLVGKALVYGVEALVYRIEALVNGIENAELEDGHDADKEGGDGRQGAGVFLGPVPYPWHRVLLGDGMRREYITGR